MVPRISAFLLVLLFLGCVPVSAQEREEAGSPTDAVAADDASTPARLVPPAPVELWAARAEKRPLALTALYGSYAAVQALDVVSTQKAIGAGAQELNPAMGAGGRARMVAVKSAATALSIYVVERTWKKNRLGAIATMVAVNGVSAAIAARNFRNARR